jgi:hypothetical protein
MKVVAENVQFLRIKRPDESSMRDSPSVSAGEANAEAPKLSNRRRKVRPVAGDA